MCARAVRVPPPSPPALPLLPFLPPSFVLLVFFFFSCKICVTACREYACLSLLLSSAMHKNLVDAGRHFCKLCNVPRYTLVAFLFYCFVFARPTGRRACYELVGFCRVFFWLCLESYPLLHITPNTYVASILFFFSAMVFFFLSIRQRFSRWQRGRSSGRCRGRDQGRRGEG